jgi:hypothetical protein
VSSPRLAQPSQQKCQPTPAGGTASLTCFASCPTAELLHRPAAPAPWPAPPAFAVAAAALAPAPAGPAAAERAPAFALPPMAAAAAAAAAGAAPHDPRPFFMSESFSDAVLAAGDARFPAHRLVLAASPRFREARAPAGCPVRALHGALRTVWRGWQLAASNALHRGCGGEMPSDPLAAPRR